MAQGATPQLFGAPSPSDPGGAFSASVSSAQQTAQTQVQATQQAVSNILQSLQFALTVKERRTQQAKEIEAANTLESMRQNRADARDALNRSAMDARSAADNEAAMRRERLQQRGMTFRDWRKNQQDSAQFALEYGQRERELQLKGAEAQARLREMSLNAEAKRQNAMAAFGKSLLSTALAMRPFEPGPFGTAKLREDFLSAGGAPGTTMGGTATALQAAGGALGGPMGAGMRNTGQAMQAGMPALAEELRAHVKEPNQTALDAARIKGDQSQPIPVQGLVQIPGDVLKSAAEKLGIGPMVEGALRTGTGAGGASVVFNPQSRQLEVMGGSPQAQAGIDALNQRGKANPDLFAFMLGSAVNPFAKEGVVSLGQRLLAGNPEALTTSPQGGGGYQPQQGAPGFNAGPNDGAAALQAKPPQQGAPQGQGAQPRGAVPAQSPSQAAGAQGGQRNLSSLVTGQGGADRQATGDQASMDREAFNLESRYRESASKYLQKFGVSSSALGEPGKEPPLDPWAVEEKYGNVKGNPVNSLRRVLGMNPAGYYFYADVPESEVKAREAEIQRERAPKPAQAPASQAAPPSARSKATSNSADFLSVKKPYQADLGMTRGTLGRGGQYRGPQDTTPTPPGPARKDGAAFAATRSKVLAGVGRSSLPAAEKSRLRNDSRALLTWAVDSRDTNADALISDALADGLIDQAEATRLMQRLSSGRAAARPQRVRDR